MSDMPDCISHDAKTDLAVGLLPAVVLNIRANSKPMPACCELEIIAKMFLTACAPFNANPHEYLQYVIDTLVEEKKAYDARTKEDAGALTKDVLDRAAAEIRRKKEDKTS